MSGGGGRPALARLGATRVRALFEERVDHDAVAMRDPEGNEFDIIGPSVTAQRVGGRVRPLHTAGRLLGGMSAPGKLWVGSIVMEVQDFPKMMAFWRAALGYENREPPPEDWVVLQDPHGKGPDISFQKVPSGPSEDYRFHLDLYCSDREGEVRRLLSLGATMREPATEGRDFVTLADPDGNPFDVIGTRGSAFGQHT